jgi:hypothetical protein
MGRRLNPSALQRSTHGTGEPFHEIAKAEMPAKLLRSYTGTRFILSA